MKWGGRATGVKSAKRGARRRDAPIEAAPRECSTEWGAVTRVRWRSCRRGAIHTILVEKQPAVRDTSIETGQLSAGPAR